MINIETVINNKEIFLVDASSKEGHEFHDLLAKHGIHLRKVVGNGKMFLRVRTNYESNEEIRINAERQKLADMFKASQVAGKAAGMAEPSDQPSEHQKHVDLNLEMTKKFYET